MLNQIRLQTLSFANITSYTKYKSYSQIDQTADTLHYILYTNYHRDVVKIRCQIIKKTVQNQMMK